MDALGLDALADENGETPRGTVERVAFGHLGKLAGRVRRREPARGAGVITALTTLIVSFAGANRAGALWRLLLLAGGLAALLALARSATFDRLLQRLISRVLARYTDLDVRDYAALLRISGDYTVMELFVEDDDWIANRRLDELDLPHEGIQVLGIVGSDGGYRGTPPEPRASVPPTH